MVSQLSPRQREVMQIVESWRQTSGRAPTVREMADALGVSSTATIHQHLRALEHKGYLARQRYRRRAWQPVKPPRPPLLRRVAMPADMAQVPLVGRIAAGRPIDAVEILDEDALIDIPSSYLSTGEHYALRVVGDSMIEEGIHDGDVILVRRQDKAEPGQTVVALIDGEATVKKLYFRERLAELRPANAAMQSLYVPRDQLTIQGVVISLLRRYETSSPHRRAK